MTRGGIILAVSIAASGCAPESPEPAPAPRETVVSAPTPTPTPFASPSTALPGPLLGSWTADAAKRCDAGTPLRIIVEPDAIRFYESVARVLSVTQTDPHSWSIVASTTGEGVTREQRFSLYLGELGGLTRVEPPAPDLTYSRCQKAKA